MFCCPHMCHGRHNHSHNVSTNLNMSAIKDVTALCSESSPSFSSEGSVASKRRGTFKKWLTNPVRKLSQGRVDKGSNSTNESPKTANKKCVSTSWKNNKEENRALLKAEECHQTISDKTCATQSSKDTSITNESKLDANGSVAIVTEEDGDVTDVELPPPMKIQDHSYPPVSELPSTSITPSENIETIFCSMDLTASAESEERSGKRSETQSAVSDSAVISEEPICDTLDRDHCDVNSACDETDNSSAEVSEKALSKRKFVLQELVDTERDYVRDLGCVVDGYLELMRKEEEIQVPEDLKNGKDKIVFGNIEAIYEWHRDSFLAEIEKCLEEPERLGLLFRRYERRLNMYIVYCQNKPKSEYIVSEHLDTFFEDMRQKLGHKLQLPDLLIKPVQRITKYQLLLKDVLKWTEKAGLEKESEDLRKACNIMHIVPKAANDMMMVGRLQNFDGKITAQGKLLQQGSLMVADFGQQTQANSASLSMGSIKLKERQVFLFEQIIIFSEAVGQKTSFSNPMYIYKNHLQVNKMALIEKVDDADPNKFILKSKDPQQEGVAFLCQTLNKEARDEWVANIRAILDTQLDFLRALQSPIAYQKELTKEVSAPELSSLWNPSLRKTLSHPAAVHREKSAKVSSSEQQLGASTTSKSMRQTNKNKIKAHLNVSEFDKNSTINESESYSEVNSSNRKYSCPSDKPSSNSQKSPQLQQSSPSKGKRTFLEGLKNPLRQKKTEMSSLISSESTTCNLLSSHSLDSATGAQRRNKLDANRDNSVIRRWSESASPNRLNVTSANTDQQLQQTDSQHQ